MRKLLRQIERELKKAKHCAIYGEELNRVWPDDGNQREPKIARFAEDHGFRLWFYRDGLCTTSIESLARAAKIASDSFRPVESNVEASNIQCEKIRRQCW